MSYCWHWQHDDGHVIQYGHKGIQKASVHHEILRVPCLLQDNVAARLLKMLFWYPARLLKMLSSDIVAGFCVFCSVSKLSVTSRKGFPVVATSAVGFVGSFQKQDLIMFSRELSDGWKARFEILGVMFTWLWEEWVEYLSSHFSLYFNLFFNFLV